MHLPDSRSAERAGLHVGRHLRYFPEVADADRYRELAERVLGRSAAGREVELVLDALPPEAGGRIHLPADAQLLGAVIRRDPDGELTSIAVYLASTMNAEVLIQGARQTYGAEGFGPPPPSPAPMSGFRHSGRPGGSSVVLCHGPDGPWVQCSARAIGSGCEGVIVWNAGATMGPCTPRMHPHEIATVLEPLDAPDGVQLMPGGGYGGAGGSLTMGGSAITTLGARDLVDAFALQLIARGATRVDSGGDAVAGWSVWTLATAPWEASLFAFGRDEYKELQLRIERPDHRKREQVARGWRTYGGGIV